MTIKLNGKKISKKQALDLIGKDRLEARIKDAKEAHADDPFVLNSWMDGMSIEFDD